MKLNFKIVYTHINTHNINTRWLNYDKKENYEEKKPLQI